MAAYERAVRRTKTYTRGVRLPCRDRGLVGEGVARASVLAIRGRGACAPGVLSGMKMDKNLLIELEKRKDERAPRRDRASRDFLRP